MQKNLITTIAIAIFGVVAGFLVCNLFMGEATSVSVKTVESDISVDLVDPNPEVFNYRALNPTVEVYVGECDEYDEYGKCVEQQSVTVDTGEGEPNQENS